MSMYVNLKPDYSFLFSNMSGNTGTGFGLGNMNFLSDYYSIKNGSYGKLLKSYYNMLEEQDAASDTETEYKPPQLSTSLSADSAKTLANIDKSADRLKESADALIDRGSDSVFAQKEVTVKNEDGTTTTTKEYDMDAIYSAVSDFVKDYNSLIDTVAKSDSANIQRTASNMTNITSLYAKTLKKVGITVGTDKKLSIDEDAFKAADMAAIQSTFNDSRSFAYNISSQASFIDFAASREATKANTYNFNGTYSNNYLMGNLFNGMI